MPQLEQSPPRAASFGNVNPRGRRNLPRASHACQWCRTKKAKCNQRQPCSNCIKHSVDCEYGIRRRAGRKKSAHAHDQARGVAQRQNTLPSPATISRSRNGPSERELAGQPQVTTPSSFASRALSVSGLDVVDVNQRTRGTEFYGTSSNFVLLNQLFAFAQQQHPSRFANSRGQKPTLYHFRASFGGNDEYPTSSGNSPTTSDKRDARPGLMALPKHRVSVINLLSNEEALSPPSRPETPSHIMRDGLINPSDAVVTNGNVAVEASGSILRQSSMTVPRNARNEHTSDRPIPSCTSTAAGQSSRYATALSNQASRTRLEREYVRSFLDNLHHLHPMLDAALFVERCEKDVWGSQTTVERLRGSRHFFALYNIVVAVGALVAGSSVTKNFGRDMQLCMEQLARSESSERAVTSQTLSRIYFRRSKDLLGDTSVVCSLESAQTLLLMSLYCQNSHLPHPCYMYCGQAVRTALAIGLTNESTSMSAEDRKSARRTWWCIYSHEIDMSCSAGRRDSLGKPHNYQIPLPLIKDHRVGAIDTSESEDKSVAMVNEMVHFAAILRRISKELYHDTKNLSLPEKSMLAKELDSLLNSWKSRLPKWLDFSGVSFREEESATKQKIVLHLRYLNARILAHRLFLTPSTGQRHLDMSEHIGLCLDAARETIQLLYDAYAHRHYFRTWWYNSTYTLYAGMIVLSVVMLRATALESGDLLKDVIKAQRILESMEESTVALRSAELLREGLEIAQSSGQRDSGVSLPLVGDQADQGNDGTQAAEVDAGDLTSNGENNTPQTSSAANGYGPNPEPLFASLIDPGLLQDFTTGMNGLGGVDAYAFLFDDSFSE
ncbi:putative transcriptional regulatory protein [Paramyrothecium foliicola]|nr:putative transcriptional regulatory protein [Paramyrothecium foliicola]